MPSRTKEKRDGFQKLRAQAGLATAKDLAESKRGDDVIRQLKAWRIRKGQTMIALGQRFGVDQSYISRIVSGERLGKLST